MQWEEGLVFVCFFVLQLPLDFPPGVTVIHCHLNWSPPPRWYPGWDSPWYHLHSGILCGNGPQQTQITSPEALARELKWI